MKKITIQTDYNTHWGQQLHVTGSPAELGTWETNKAIPMRNTYAGKWQTEFEVSDDTYLIEFRLLLIEDGQLVRSEYGDSHLVVATGENTTIECIWQDVSEQKYLNASLFKNSIFRHDKCLFQLNDNETALVADCLHVDLEQELVIVGELPSLGQWNPQKAPAMFNIGHAKWYIQLAKDATESSNYKLAIRDKKTKDIVEWEDGDNRYLENTNSQHTHITEIKYRKERIEWRVSGVAIPIFSLRSKNSFGIGEFSDLHLLTDWALQAKLRVIQVLPINDTTATHTWVDSYPYNAISIYALHPIYLGLSGYRLKDEEKYKAYQGKATSLNQLDAVNYTEVIKLKEEYISELYAEIGNSILNSELFKQFYKQNENWLVPYAYFCHLRDKFNTSKISDWGNYSVYDRYKLDNYARDNTEVGNSINCVYFTQFLLHQQLTEAKEYAYSKGIALKGDIPIGISPNSVEAWTEPHLFNMDCQTGAPPDDFSINGQNWGFPTYNWRQMQQNGYQWWIKRFKKMGDYFDAYRIDHILGFFRIWEIPNTSVHGLLGYFSPAKPLSPEEIAVYQFPFCESLTIASVHNDDLHKLLGDNWNETKDVYLYSIDGEWYQLKEEYNNQQKTQAMFNGRTSEYDTFLREALYSICNEVLFVRDKYETEKYHPRISLQSTYRYDRLDQGQKNNINRLYDEFFYHRHSQYWRDEAMNKLPALIAATDMLVCGEDLGMVPESVPSVMHDLEILSLEIQRMPKQVGARFGNLKQLPYLSVTTTSTHDMSPLRLWWKEDRCRTQEYYTHVLQGKGIAPEECNTAISMQIIREHLASPAMLSILPLQDWLSISDKLKRNKAEDERINEPSNPRHNWNYRMHLELEQLVEEKDFADLVRFLNEENKR